ncbi:MAG TPA: hypothetical protein P5184_02440, partial [Bacteroidales bacterium]|nr:hypothetical protein [Bacteroidales bacterium]
MKKPRLSIIAITFLLVMISAFTFSVVAQAPVWHSADQEVSIVNNDNPPTSITVNHPDNLVSGDLIIVMIFTHDSPGTITCDDAAMTYIGSTTCVEDDGHCSGVAGFWKVATVSEPSGYTFTLTGTPDNDNSQYVKALAGRVTSWTSIGSSSNVYDSNGSPLAIPSIGGLTTPNNFLLVAGFIFGPLVQYFAF